MAIYCKIHMEVESMLREEPSTTTAFLPSPVIFPGGRHRLDIIANYVSEFLSPRFRNLPLGALFDFD